MPAISRDKLLEQLRDCKKYTTEEVLAWAQAIYDHDGPPPYAPTPVHDMGNLERMAQMEAYNKAKAELLTDFMVFWMPRMKQKD